MNRVRFLGALLTGRPAGAGSLRKQPKRIMELKKREAVIASLFR